MRRRTSRVKNRRSAKRQGQGFGMSHSNFFGKRDELSRRSSSGMPGAGCSGPPVTARCCRGEEASVDVDEEVVVVDVAVEVEVDALEKSLAVKKDPLLWPALHSLSLAES